MILEKLVVENFRQFRGRQEISFSTIRERNVTVVHAENGFGKTALLNALLWGFYGHDGLTEDLPKKDSIIHEGAAARSKDPSSTSARVMISFTHDSEKYHLQRELTLDQQRFDPKKTDLLLERNLDGIIKPEQFAQKKINSLMPPGISEFLFFNGEGIEHLAREENSAKITDAIRQMLGLKLLETAIEDLQHQSVLGKLRAELRERTNNAKAAKIDELTATDNSISEYTTRKATNHDNIIKADKELEKVDAKLELNKVAHQLQIRRKELDLEEASLNGQLAEKSKRVGQIVAEDSYSLFSLDLVSRGREITNKLRADGKIPARVLNSFLQELLDNCTCICKGRLEKGSPERKAVEDLMTYAGDAQFNNAVGALDNSLGRLAEAADQTSETLWETNKERLRIRERLKIVKEELEDIHQKIGGKDDEEIHTLETSRESWKQKQREFLREQGEIDKTLSDFAKKREDLIRDIKEIQDNEADAQRAQRRLNAVEDAAKLLQRLLDIETEELRPMLNSKIDEHFRKIIGVGYWAELSEDFVLKIMKHLTLDDVDNIPSQTVDMEVALSQGQRQVTSLVFIASLVALARGRSEIPTIVKGLSGSENPLVMDSPFGQLSQFRAGIARWIPALAPQVIILVSHTQYDGDVANELKKSKRIGKRYYLAYHGPNIHSDAKRELQIGKAPVTVYHEEREEFSEICELES